MGQNCCNPSKDDTNVNDMRGDRKKYKKGDKKLEQNTFKQMPSGKQDFTFCMLIDFSFTLQSLSLS